MVRLVQKWIQEQEYKKYVCRLLKIIQSDPCTAGSAVARISWLENEIVDKLITFRDINLI